MSGVVLANASLDIAFHDTVLSFSLAMASTRPSININDNPLQGYQSFRIPIDRRSTHMYIWVDSFGKSDYDSYIKQF